MKSRLAKTQHQITAPDLQLVLALARAGTMAAAGKRLGVDQSTVFRSLQTLEKRLGSTLFSRHRSGCRPTEAGELLAQHGERLEAVLETARVSAGTADGPVEGRVRVTSTDVILNHLVIPLLRELCTSNPLLRLDVVDSYELANLSKRDADIAVRATSKPPVHMVGRSLGTIHEAVFAKRVPGSRSETSRLLERTPWIVVDEALPGHPSMRWRKRNVPGARICMNASSIQTVLDAVVAGVGIGILPTFMARGRRELVQVTPAIGECDSELWLLCHPESRHLRRVLCVFDHLGTGLRLD